MVTNRQNPERSVKRNLILSTAYQVLTLILPLITAPYASRVLGVEGMGIYSYTHSYSMYFSLFASLGTITYGTREIARHRHNRAERSKFFWEIAILTILTSSVSLLGWGIWTALNKRYRIYYIILTFGLLGTMFDISWFYAGMEEFRFIVTQNSIFKILGTIAIFGFVKAREDLGLYIFILSSTTLLANISMWIYLPRFICGVQLKNLSLKKHFYETLVYFIPTIATSVYTILDKTLIGIITKDASENGNYEQATKIVNMAKTVAFAGVNMVLQSRISYLFAENKTKEIKYRITASMDYILYIGTALCFGIIGVSKRFVPFFFGPGYEKTIILLRLLAPLIIIVGISNCLGSQYYNPAGLRAKSSKYIVVGSIVNLILNIVLIPSFRSVGAVTATLVAELVITVLYFSNSDGYYTLRQLLSQLSKKLVSGVIMCLSVSLLALIIKDDFVCLFGQIGVGVFIYLSISFLLKDTFAENVLFAMLDRFRNK